MRSRGFGLLFLLALSLSGCREEVYDGLSQRDANEMTALLLAAGLDAKRIQAKDGTFAVHVDEGDFAVAVNLISDSGLPRPEFRTMTDVFSDDRLIASPAEERARLAYAMSQELSRTVSEIDGVVSARVHLSAPNLDQLGRSTRKSSASVAIHHEDGLDTEGLVPRIKLLVAHAVDDLSYDDVLVALFPVRRTVPLSSGAAGADVLVSEMVWPASGLAMPDASGNAQRARGSAVNPAVAAILAGGLIVLFIAARGLFDGPRRRRAEADGAYELIDRADSGSETRGG